MHSSLLNKYGEKENNFTNFFDMLTQKKYIFVNISIFFEQKLNRDRSRPQLFNAT